MEVPGQHEVEDRRNAPRDSREVAEQDPEVGWVYPNIDMFGQEWNSDYSGEYSVLRHLEENICEAGSLVRRAVFERGARFDESMRLGFEDWDFWLGAIERGFRGKHLENFGFRYRRRPESMLSDSERDRLKRWLRGLRPGPAASDLVVTATVEVPVSDSEPQYAWEVAWEDAGREAEALGAGERTAQVLAAGAGTVPADGSRVVVAAHGEVLLARWLPQGW